jgi:hypothetical protein
VDNNKEKQKTPKNGWQIPDLADIDPKLLRTISDNGNI